VSADRALIQLFFLFFKFIFSESTYESVYVFRLIYGVDVFAVSGHCRTKKHNKKIWRLYHVCRRVGAHIRYVRIEARAMIEVCSSAT